MDAVRKDARFGGINRLYGNAGREKLRRSHVCVIGIGGVGCWVVEALARSGVGKLTLVDLDDLCETNINRQLHALTETVGQLKVEAMKSRVLSINPVCEVHCVTEFFSAETSEQILATPFDFVVDAIDNATNKIALISECRRRGLPIICSGSAGGRRKAEMVRLSDIADCTHDRLISRVREKLRKEHNFPPPGKKFGVPCVFSPEPPVFPQSDGCVAATRQPGAELGIGCDTGYGTASFIVGTFGFLLAGHVVNALANSEPQP
jgi:tRNA A37 threonylcarbamoyladenosine dehydratase